MNVFFDTSVLVPAVVDQLPNHAACFACFAQYTTDDHTAFCSSHGLAEAYAVLTSLPLPRRISSHDAWKLIENSFLQRLTVVPLLESDYARAIRDVAESGRTGGSVYDALHVAAAKKSDCERIYTYNISHFEPLSAEEIAVTTP